jgi:hypothetical protein
VALLVLMTVFAIIGVRLGVRVPGQLLDLANQRIAAHLG